MVPATWTECRRCGTAIVAVPAAVSAGGVGVASANGHEIPPPPSAPSPPLPFSPAPAASEVVPDTMLPYVDPLLIRAPAKTGLRWNARTIAVSAVALLVVVAGVYSAIPHGGSHAKTVPTILAPRPPFAGIPTSLSDIVRIAAESARHTAISAVIEAAGTSGAQLTTPQLTAALPNYQWIGGAETSTTNTIVSITSGPGIDVIAVAGTDRDICAFGRWTPTLGSEYVTMAHQPNCAATNAPTSGWSPLTGGSAEDLPGVDGN